MWPPGRVLLDVYDIGPGIFRNTQKNTEQKRTQKQIHENYAPKTLRPKTINPLCNLRDLSELFVIQFLSKLQESRD